MPGENSLLSGPDPEALADRAFELAASQASADPGSVLCLTQTRERAETLERHWREEYDQLRLTCSTLDDYVGELYEDATGTLSNSTLTGAHQFRLIEAAIEQYGQAVEDGPFAGIKSPANDLVDQVQGMFSLLKYAGYDTPESIETALLAAGADGSQSLDDATLYGYYRDGNPPQRSLTEQADAFSGLYAEYERLREAVHPEWREDVATRYLELLDEDLLQATVPAEVDVIVLDGLTRLAPAERETVKRFAAAYPTVATLPLIHESLEGHGIDSGVQRALALYHALEFELEYQTPGDVVDERLAVLRCLYDRNESTPSPTAEEIELTVTEPATEREEVRSTARKIRGLLNEGVAPADIGIVVTDRATYRSVFSEALLAYDIPFTFVNDIGIEQTLVGDAVHSLLDLADTETPTPHLQDLAANTLMSLDAFDIDTAALSSAARETSDQTLDGLIDTLEERGEETTADGIRDLVTSVDPNGAGLDEYTTAVEAVLESLGVEESVKAYDRPAMATGSHRPAQERSAWRAVKRVISSYDAVAPYLTDTDPAGRLRRALRAELVGGPDQQPGYVRVYPIAEAEMASFDHLFALGLTMGYFPEESDTMAFFEAVNDADEAFEREHTGRRARYILGTLLAGSDEVTLSIPQHTVEGTSHVPAPLVSELERYVDQTDSDEDSEALPHVVSEDVQETYQNWAVGEAFSEKDRATEPLAAADGLGQDARAFAEQGATCSWRRSRAGLSEHEAQIPELVDTVYPEGGREPFSPSALEDYARCPFVFLMKRVLNFEEDYGDEEGITRGDRGTYIHAVLAGFYRRLRTSDGQPIDPNSFDRDTLEETLTIVALEQLDDLEDPETPFERRTLGRLLAGLGEPSRNPHHDYGGPGGEGLFVRFLEKEMEEQADVATQPTYFEAAVDVDYDGVESVAEDPVTIETPEGPIQIRGSADRVDSTNDPPYRFHVRDYKTGTTPAAKDVTGGKNLQLPLYALILESALEERTGDPHQAIAGSYYKFKNPDDIKPKDGEPSFDSDEEFTSFIRDVTPTRVGRIGTAIENGSFQPTLLSERDANCEDCTFRHGCDVRHHLRRDTIEELDDADQTHYISERARDRDLDLAAYTDRGEE